MFVIVCNGSNIRSNTNKGINISLVTGWSKLQPSCQRKVINLHNIICCIEIQSTVNALPSLLSEGSVLFPKNLSSVSRAASAAACAYIVAAVDAVIALDAAFVADVAALVQKLTQH